MDIRTVLAALEPALDHQRRIVEENESCYERGYLEGLERAADIVAIKARGGETGLER